MNRFYALTIALLVAPIANFHAMEKEKNLLLVTLATDFTALQQSTNDAINLELGKSSNCQVSIFDLSQHESGTLEHFSVVSKLTRLSLKESVLYYKICCENQPYFRYFLSGPVTLDHDLVDSFKTSRNSLTQCTQILADVYLPKNITEKYQRSLQFRLLLKKVKKSQEFLKSNDPFLDLQENDIDLTKNVSELDSLLKKLH
jgi:hypothetical protein